MRASTCRWLYLNILGPELDELMRDREPRIEDAASRSLLILICGLEDLVDPKYRRQWHPPSLQNTPIGRHLPGAASAPSLEAHHHAKVVISTTITPLTQPHINVNSFSPSLSYKHLCHRFIASSCFTSGSFAPNQTRRAFLILRQSLRVSMAKTKAPVVSEILPWAEEGPYRYSHSHTSSTRVWFNSSRLLSVKPWSLTLPVRKHTLLTAPNNSSSFRQCPLRPPRLRSMPTAYTMA